MTSPSGSLHLAHQIITRWQPSACRAGGRWTGSSQNSREISRILRATLVVRHALTRLLHCLVIRASTLWRWIQNYRRYIVLRVWTFRLRPRISRRVQHASIIAARQRLYERGLLLSFRVVRSIVVELVRHDRRWGEAVWLGNSQGGGTRRQLSRIL